MGELERFRPVNSEYSDLLSNASHRPTRCTTLGYHISLAQFDQRVCFPPLCLNDLSRDRFAQHLPSKGYHHTGLSGKGIYVRCSNGSKLVVYPIH